MKKGKIARRILAGFMAVAVFGSGFPMGQPEESAVKAAVETEVTLSNPVVDEENNVTTWDTISFGNYYQSDINKEEREPIKWRVLSVEGDKALLLADKVLDSREYKEKDCESGNWQDSTIRSWLNGYDENYNANNLSYTSENFIDTAFSEVEQAAIETTTVETEAADKIFLLSASEALNPAYGFSDDPFEYADNRVAQMTNYLFDLRNSPAEQGMDYWWLRTSATEQDGYADRILAVGDDGYIDDFGWFLLNSLGVRPAMYVDLSQKDAEGNYLWEYTGEVSSLDMDIIRFDLETTYVGDVEGEGGELDVEVYPEDATQKLVYSSSNESVVTVDEDGDFMLVGAGTATITVGVEGNPDIPEQYCLVEVEEKVDHDLVEPDKDEDTGEIRWDTIEFGRYYQSDATGTTMEPIRWRILHLDRNHAMLISDMILDSKPYHTEYENVTWEESTLRSWLNGYGASANSAGEDYSEDNFLDTAFTETEQEAIVKFGFENVDNVRYPNSDVTDTMDRIQLFPISSPSEEEVDIKNSAQNTAYAAAQGGELFLDGQYESYGAWWLQTNGVSPNRASYVEYNGDIDYRGAMVDETQYGVRPVLCIDLTKLDSSLSDVLKSAGIVSSEDRSIVSIEMAKTELEVVAGETLQLGATVVPSNATDTLVYEVQDDSVVSVDENGNVTALKAGTTEVTVSASKNSYVKKICSITVVAEPEVTPTPAPTASPDPSTNPSGGSESGGTQSGGATGTDSGTGVTSQPTATPAAVTPSDQKVAAPKGSKLQDKKTKNVYTVTSAKAGKETVAYAGTTNAKATAITVPTSVTINGVKYKVTSIAAKAFYKNKKLKKVTIPSSITKIGKKAFFGCKKLKKITIKSKKLTKKNVGSKAFKGIHKKAVIKVPKSCKKSYKKMLKARGVGKKAKIK